MIDDQIRSQSVSKHPSLFTIRQQNRIKKVKTEMNLRNCLLNIVECWQEFEEIEQQLLMIQSQDEF